MFQESCMLHTPALLSPGPDSGWGSTGIAGWGAAKQPARACLFQLLAACASNSARVAGKLARLAHEHTRRG
eukprot:1159080-Pelagomonas_calceolata.AAC.10